MASANKIRQQTDVAHLLTRLKIEYKVNGDELIATCPHKKHPDKTPSWKIHDGGEKNGFFYCFPCSWGGDVFTLVEYVKQCHFIEAVEFVKKSCKRKIEILEDSEDDYEELFESYEPSKVRKPDGLKLPEKESRCLEYLQERGINAHEIKRYGILDWPWKQRAWVPLTRNNILISWLARSYTGKNPKVITPKGNEGFHDWAFFGLDQADKYNQTINFTEGWISCIRLYQAGFDNPVAACGSVITEEQVDELSWVKRIIQWQEGDVAGRAMTRDLRQWFGRRCRIDVVELPKKKDPADFSSSTLRKLFDIRGNN